MRDSAAITVEMLDRYARFWTDLTVDSIDALEELSVDDVTFTDPFNDVRGRPAFKSVLKHMFENTDRPRFHVLDRAIGNHAGYLRWDFTFHPMRRGQARAEWRFTGMSEVSFASDGRVISHIDHWDASTQLYARLPVIGPMLRFVRARLRATDTLR